MNGYIKNEAHEYQQKLLHLIKEGSTLSLATLNSQGEAEASSVPYIFYENVFWIFVSHLSSHTANLLQHKKAGILIVEKESPNLFASTRTSMQCNVNIEKSNKETILSIMKERLGETVTMLKQLPDFYLIKLSPVSGRFIAGFGKAFEINFSDLSLKHIHPAR